MITRMWQGRTTVEHADAYEDLLRTKILPGIRQVAGYRGAFVLRRDVEEGVEFVTLTQFDSLEAVRAFAGDDYATAVILPEAERLLARAEPTALHYDTVITPE
jgi:heme-degrading monooxygenase HmoA